MSESTSLKSTDNRLLSRRQTDEEILRIVDEVLAGNLRARAQVDAFTGLDRELLENLNRMVDRLVSLAAPPGHSLGVSGMGNPTEPAMAARQEELFRRPENLNLLDLASGDVK